MGKLLKGMVHLLVIFIALGLTTRYFPVGKPIWDRHLGDVFWGAALYCVIALGVRRRRLVIAAGIAIAVEFFKLTGIPAQMSHVAPVRWLFGTTFSWHNIPLYLVGIILVHVIKQHKFNLKYK